MTRLALALALLLAVSAHAAEPRHSKLLRITQAILAGGQAADVATSWGKPELNPALRGAGGTFGARGLSLKIGLVAGELLAERFIVHRAPKAELVIAPLNLAAAGLFAGQAVHNGGVR